MDNIGFKITKTKDGKYKMTITKEYTTGNKQELVSEISDDLRDLVNKFEHIKFDKEEVDKNEKDRD